MENQTEPTPRTSPTDIITLEDLEEQIAGIQLKKIEVTEQAKLLLLQLDAAEQALQILAIPARKARAVRLANLGTELAAVGADLPPTPAVQE